MANVQALQRQGWYLTAEGIEECTINGRNTAEDIMEVAKHLDLKQIGEKHLPDGSRTGKTDAVDGPFVLQINKVRNVSAPKDDEENHGAPQMLRLTLTDGIQTCTALEMESVNGLSINTPPGTKIKLLGKVPLNHGFLHLNNSNVKVIGGNVESLVKNWKIKRELAKHTRTGLTTESGGPPAFIPFGQRQRKMEDQHPRQRRDDFKSLKENIDKKEDNEFEQQRQATIEEVLKSKEGAANKKFGGKQVQDKDVAKMVDMGFTSEDATVALKTYNGNVAEAIDSLCRPREDIRGRGRGDHHAPRDHVGERDFNGRQEGGRGRGRRGRDNDESEDAPSRPSAPATLFDFLNTKIPSKGEGHSDGDKASEPRESRSRKSSESERKNLPNLPPRLIRQQQKREEEKQRHRCDSGPSPTSQRPQNHKEDYRGGNEDYQESYNRRDNYRGDNYRGSYRGGRGSGYRDNNYREYYREDGYRNNHRDGGYPNDRHRNDGYGGDRGHRGGGGHSYRNQGGPPREFQDSRARNPDYNYHAGKGNRNWHQEEASHYRGPAASNRGRRGQEFYSEPNTKEIPPSRYQQTKRKENYSGRYDNRERVEKDKELSSSSSWTAADNDHPAPSHNQRRGAGDSVNKGPSSSSSPSQVNSSIEKHEEVPVLEESPMEAVPVHQPSVHDTQMVVAEEIPQQLQQAPTQQQQPPTVLAAYQQQPMSHIQAQSQPNMPPQDIVQYSVIQAHSNGDTYPGVPYSQQAFIVSNPQMIQQMQDMTISLPVSSHVTTSSTLNPLSQSFQPGPDGNMYAHTPIQAMSSVASQGGYIVAGGIPTTDLTQGKPIHQWKPGDFCLAKYWEDKQFYRAVVQSVAGAGDGSSYFVQFPDYGNFEEVHAADIRPTSKEVWDSNTVQTQSIPVAVSMSMGQVPQVPGILVQTPPTGMMMSFPTADQAYQQQVGNMEFIPQAGAPTTVSYHHAAAAAQARQPTNKRHHQQPRVFMPPPTAKGRPM